MARIAVVALFLVTGLGVGSAFAQVPGLTWVDQGTRGWWDRWTHYHDGVNQNDTSNWSTPTSFSNNMVVRFTGSGSTVTLSGGTVPSEHSDTCSYSNQSSVSGYANVTVADMYITAGNYTFFGSASANGSPVNLGGTGAIIGVRHQFNAQTTSTGKLYFQTPGMTTLYVETQFIGGYVFDAGTIRLRDDKALGVYAAYITGSNVKSDAYGLVEVRGEDATTMSINTGTDSIGRTIQTRFEVGENKTLSFGIPYFSPSSSTVPVLTIKGVDTSGWVVENQSGQQSPIEGGAIYLKAGANIDHTGVGGRVGALSFETNTAIRGGAIYATNDLNINGNTKFDGNVATEYGGAIYMHGLGTSNTLSLHVLDQVGDILFQNNSDRYGGNAVFLAGNTNIDIAGSRYIYFDDAISSNAASENNSLTMDLRKTGSIGSGFVQFSGGAASVLNPHNKAGGHVQILSGEFRVIERTPAISASFTTLGNDSFFDVLAPGQTSWGGTRPSNPAANNVGGILAGNGTLQSGQGFRISGTVSPDSYEYRIPTELSDATPQTIATSPNVIGNLRLQGDVTFSGATLKVDLGTANRTDTATAGAYKTSDTVKVSANSIVGYSGRIYLDSENKNTIAISTWDNGQYIIASAVNGFFGDDGATLLTNLTVADYFNDLVPPDLNASTVRRNAMLSFVTNEFGGGSTEQDLVLTTSDNGNINVVWTNKADTYDWNTSHVNWKRQGTNLDTMFRANDTVLFNVTDNRTFDAATGTQYVNINPATATDWTDVGGMTVTGGDYYFYKNGDTINQRGIRGTTTASGMNATGRLDIEHSDPGATSTTVTLAVNTDFEMGTRIGNAKVILGFDGSLGVYNAAEANTERGTVTVNGEPATIVTSLFGDDRTLQNHFELKGAAALTFDVPAGKELTISGVDTTNKSAALNHRGGAFFIDNGATMTRTPGSKLTLSNNTAVNGGGIYAMRNLTLQGNLLFQGNEATGTGGAIYMEGGLNTSNRAAAVLDTDDGDIVFTGNDDSTGDNSIHFKQFTDLTIQGAHNVFFDDPLSTELGGNSFTMNGTGIVQLKGVSDLNAGSQFGGGIDINSGTLRIADGATFTTSAAQNTAYFNLAAGATLAGQGTINVIGNNREHYFEIAGAISPDSDVFTSALHGGTPHQTVDVAEKIGRLTLNNDTLLNGATLVIDIGDNTGTPGGDAALGDADLITVTGNITLSDANGLNVVELFAVENTTPDGNYLIMQATGAGNTFVGAGGETTAAALLTYFEALETSVRQGGTLAFRESTVGQGYDELWIENYTGGKNAAIYWTGSTDGTTVNSDWDNRISDNWITGRGGEITRFYQNDYVIFDNVTVSVVPNAYDVVMTEDMTVTGMEIVAGNYTFSPSPDLVGPATGKIVGGIGGNLAAGRTGRLDVKGGSAKLGVATEFYAGTQLSGGRITIAHNDALGVYDHTDFNAYNPATVAGSRQGYINVTGAGTIAVDAAATIAGAKNYTIVNRFDVVNGGGLTFNVGANETLTIDGVDVTADNSNGGAITIATGGTFANSGAGTLAFTHNEAANGGAIYAADALTLGGTVQFAENFASGATAGQGGAIYAGGGLTTTGKTTFTGNVAENGGGAIYALGGVTLGGESTFTGNQTPSGHGGAIHVASGNLTINAKATFGGTNAVAGNQAYGTGARGGAVYVANGNVVIAAGAADTSFGYNTATGLGGAIYTGGNVDIAAATTFTRNEATNGIGGAIYADGNVTISAAGTAFRNNTAGEGGAISTRGNVTIDAATTFEANSAGWGGAISTLGNVSIGGGVKFLDNTATNSGGVGGAIYMNGDPRLAPKTLSIDATGGDIVFKSTTDTISLNDNVDMMLTGADRIYFGGQVLVAGTTNTFTMNMNNAADPDPAGLAIFKADASFGGDSAINGGVIHVGTGVTLTTTGNMTQAAGATLAGSGTYAIDGAGTNTFSGNLSADNYVYTLDANNAITRNGAAIGTMTLVGDMTLDSATLRVDLGATGNYGDSDWILVDGEVATMGGNNKTKVTIGDYLGGAGGSFSNGTFAILTTQGNDTLDINHFYVDPKNYGDRNSVELDLTADGKTLLIKTTNDGMMALYWTGHTDDVWVNLDNTKMNWIDRFDDTGIRQYFKNGDEVIFADDATYVEEKTVRIDESNVRVSGMQVTGTGYTFNALSGTPTIYGNGNADLTITAASGTTTFNVETDFDGDLAVSGGGTTVFAQAAKFDGDATIDGSTATFQNTLNVGTDLNLVNGATGTVAATTIGNNLNVDASNLTATGAVTVANNATITGSAATTFNNTLDVDNDLLVDNTGLAANSFTVTGDLTVDGGVKLENVATTTLGNVTINGIYDDGAPNTYASLLVNAVDYDTASTGMSTSLTVTGDATITDDVAIFNVGNVNFQKDLTTTDGNGNGNGYLTVGNVNSFNVTGKTDVAGTVTIQNVIGAVFHGGTGTVGFEAGALDIEDSTVTLHKASDITSGTTLTNGTVVIGDNQSLDEYAGAGGRGTVAVNGASTVRTLTGTDLAVTNEFNVDANANLTLDVVAGSKLTLNAGGNVNLGNNGTLTANVADGRELVFQSVVDGGTGTGQSFVKTGNGTVVFDSTGSTVNGTTTVNTGTLKVLAGADYTSTGLLTVENGGALAGEGTITANVRVDGILSAGDVAGQIGTLTFNGDMTLGTAQIDIDLDADNIPEVDSIVVSGGISFANPPSKENLVIVNITGAWNSKSYHIIDTGTGFTPSDKETILSHFDVTFNNNPLSSRQSATLEVRDDDVSKVDNSELWVTLGEIKSLKLYWNGTNSNLWDTNATNWYEAPNDGSRQTEFWEGDYVVFQGWANRNTVQIEGDHTVSSMDIESGSFTFNGGKITGDASTSNDSSLGATGRLNITTDGTVTFNNATAFDQGTHIGGVANTTIVLGNDEALGSTENGSNQGKVYLDADAEATVRTADGSNRTIANRFITGAGSQLNLTAVEGTALIVTNSTGWAIQADGDVDVSGAVSFLDNVGGAISMGDGTTLTLDTGNGDIVFQDRTGSNANSLRLGDNATLETVGQNDQNDIWFYDPIRGSGNATFTKNDTGTVHLLGDNSFGNAGTVVVNAGTLRLENGAALNVGSGTYDMRRGTTLSGYGTVTATGGITVSGTVSADDGSGSGIGTIDLVGNTEFSGATLAVDLADGGLCDTINVTNGTVTFDGSNIVRISAWYHGTYDLVSSDPGTMGSIGQWTILQSDGSELSDDDRLHAEVVKNNDVLQLITEGENANLVWNRTYTQEWNNSTRNWTNTDDKINDKFYSGDAVTFDGTSQGQGQGSEIVEVTATGVTTSGMKVTAGTYTFNGGTIYGRKDGTTLDNPTGGLRISGGTTTFNTKADFEGPIELLGTNTSVALNENGRFVSGDAFVLGSGTTLYLTPQTGSIVADNVTFAGTVVVNRPSSRQTIENVIQSTGDALDMDRMHEVFDGSYGLVSQSAEENGPNAINLNYDLMTPGEFADRQDLGWNMSEAADALTEIFAQGAGEGDVFEELYDYMYGLPTNEDVTYVLDRFRGTEQAADALTMAMWRPWEKVFKQLSDDYCRNQEPTEDVRFKRHYNRRHFWFEGYYRYTDVRTDHNARKYHENRGGMMLGMDLLMERNGNSAVGISFGYGKPRLTSRFGEIEADDYTLALYAKTRFAGGSQLQGFIGYGTQRFDYERYGLDSFYRARYSGDAMYMSLEWFRDSAVSRHLSLAPVAAVDLQSTWTNSFNEKGDLYRQNVDNSSLSKVFARVGVRAKYRWTDRINVSARMQYAYMFEGKARASVDTCFAASPSTNMHLLGVRQGRNWLNLGIGSELYIGPSKRMRFFVDYDFDYIGRAAAHSGLLGLGIGW